MTIWKRAIRERAYYLWSAMVNRGQGGRLLADAQRDVLTTSIEAQIQRPWTSIGHDEARQKGKGRPIGKRQTRAAR